MKRTDVYTLLRWLKVEYGIELCDWRSDDLFTPNSRLPISDRTLTIALDRYFGDIHTEPQ